MNWLKLIPETGNISIIGGGGKTSLISILERKRHQAGLPTLVTLTTRLGRDQLPQLKRVEAENLADAQEARLKAEAGAEVLLAGPLTQDSLALGTYAGLPLAWFGPLRRAASPDLLFLIEADGSAGRPLKCHRANEPFLPPLVNFVVAVLGLTALVRPWTETVHRPEILSHWVELPPPPPPPPPEEIASLILGAWTKLSPSLIFLNQADALTTSTEKELGRRLMKLLIDSGFPTVMGSLRPLYDSYHAVVLRAKDGPPNREI